MLRCGTSGFLPSGRDARSQGFPTPCGKASAGWPRAPTSPAAERNHTPASIARACSQNARRGRLPLDGRTPGPAPPRASPAPTRVRITSGSTQPPPRPAVRRPKGGEVGHRDHHGRKLARWTGLEPATPGVTGRYSNQLSYHRALEGADKGFTGGRQAGNARPRPRARAFFGKRRWQAPPSPSVGRAGVGGGAREGRVDRPNSLNPC